MRNVNMHNKVPVNDKLLWNSVNKIKKFVWINKGVKNIIKVINRTQKIKFIDSMPRDGARNFYLRGPSCSINIFIKTTSHIHIYTCFFIIYTFFYLISYIYIHTHTHTKKKKKKSLVFSIKIMFDGNFS